MRDSWISQLSTMGQQSFFICLLVILWNNNEMRFAYIFKTAVQPRVEAHPEHWTLLAGLCPTKCD